MFAVLSGCVKQAQCQGWDLRSSFAGMECNPCVVATSSQAFPLAWSVLLLQMVATVLLVLPLWAIGAVDFPRLSLDKAKQLAPVSVFYAMNTAFALLGLRSLNIPM